MALTSTRTNHFLKNYQSQNFSKGQKYRKIFQKNKTKQKFREDCKKNKRKILKPKAKQGAIKKASKKAIKYMKKANYLQTDDDKNLMIKTVGHNRDADVNITKTMTIKPKTSITQQQAEEIINNIKV